MASSIQGGVPCSSWVLLAKPLGMPVGAGRLIYGRTELAGVGRRWLHRRPGVTAESQLAAAEPRVGGWRGRSVYKSSPEVTLARDVAGRGSWVVRQQLQLK